MYGGSGERTLAQPTSLSPEVDDPAEILRRTEALVDAWCERRCLGALRQVLDGYPLTSPLTDGWGALGDALKAVRAFASDELIADEPAEVERLIAAVDHVVSVRLS
jgi:hypothetical protein